jgi:hypothetical protein
MSKFNVRFKEQHKFKTYDLQDANSNTSDTMINHASKTEVGKKEDVKQTNRKTRMLKEIDRERKKETKKKLNSTKIKERKTKQIQGKTSCCM